jgi:CheY-like chemotaxis protein
MKKANILVIDDDKELREELTEIIRAEGYAVTTAKDGFDAKHQLENKKFRLVLLDLNIPFLSGYNLLEMISNDLEGTKVIVITGNAVKPESPTGYISREDKILQRAEKIFSKPYNVPDLLKEISRIMAQTASQEEKGMFWAEK